MIILLKIVKVKVVNIPTTRNKVSKRKFRLLVSYVLFLTNCSVKSQILKVEIVTKSSNSFYHSSPVYNGDDTIYLVGGGNFPMAVANFTLFNITSGSVSRGQNLTYWTDVGQTGAQMDSYGNIFYNVPLSDLEQSFNPKNINMGERTNLLAYPSLWLSKIQLENDVIAFLGAGENMTGFMTFDMITKESKIADKQLPFPLMRPVATRIGNKAIVFGSQNKSYPSAFELNLDTLEVEQQSGNDFPCVKFFPGVAQHNGLVYLIGGYNDTEESQTPTNGIIQLDPTTFNWRFIPVEGFPIQPDQYFEVAPATVFVEKLNRIYFFGGYARSMTNNRDTYFEEIWYIDLTPLDDGPPTSTATPSTSTTLIPSIISCVNRTDGKYPHPYECDMFIICHNTEMELFECPPPLLFHPKGRRCELPENVDCDLSCLDKPDDHYSHPHDCALFIICHAGQMDVFKCPENLLFDPESRSCDLPELVSCSNASV